MDVETTRSTAEVFLVDQGSSAAFGMIGAAILYLVMAPVDNKGRFNRKEFVIRLAVAGIFSIFFGDMLASTINHFVPWLDVMDNKSAIDLLAGAPGWWVSRAAALWFHNRHDKDLGQIIKDVKENKDV